MKMAEKKETGEYIAFCPLLSLFFAQFGDAGAHFLKAKKEILLAMKSVLEAQIARTEGMVSRFEAKKEPPKKVEVK
jgi:hypothetical protein